MNTETGQRVQQQQQQQHSAGQQQQQQARPCDERARRLTGTDRQPVCERDGTFSARQCHGGTCYCVDPEGNQLQYRSRPQEGATCREYTVLPIDLLKLRSVVLPGHGRAPPTVRGEGPWPPTIVLHCSLVIFQSMHWLKKKKSIF